MERLYRIPGDNAIYVGDPYEVEIPDDMMEIKRTCMVRPCSPEDADYKVSTKPLGNSLLYYQFITEDARQRFLRGEPILRTIDKETVTNPACLAELEIDKEVCFLVSADEEGVV